VTGEDGRFLFDLPKREREYLLTIAGPHGGVAVGYAHLHRDRHFGDIALRHDCTLTGAVLTDDGRPVPGVAVQTELRLEADYGQHYVRGPTVRTDAEGEFELTGLNPGTYRCRVLSSDHTPGANTIAVSDGLSYLELRVGRAAKFGGRIVDADDRPVAGISIRTCSTPAVTTDRRGIFLLGGLEAGKHEVMVSGRGYVRSRNAPLKIRLRAGRTLTREINVVPTGSLVLRLKPQVKGVAIPTSIIADIRKPDGCAPVHGDLESEVVDGIATFHDIAPGSFEVAVQNGELGTPTTEAIVYSGRKTVADLVLPRVFALRGRAVDEAGRPLAEAAILAEIRHKGRRWPGADDWRHSTTEADGRFTLQGLPAGVVSIKVGHPDAVSCSEEIQVEAGASLTRTFTLKNGLTLAGRAISEDGRPLEGAEVTAKVEEPEEDDKRWRADSDGKYAEADRHGRFALRGLRAGRIGLVIRHDDAMALSEEIVLKTGTVLERAFTLKEGHAITGQVVDARGEPLEGASVKAQPKYEPDQDGRRFYIHQERTDETDESGRFRLAGLPEGEVRFVIEHDHAVSLRRQLKLATGEPVSGTFTLQDGVQISGRVQEADGAPADGRVTVAGPTGRTLGARTRRSADTDEHGRFRARGLAPGAYRVSFERQEEWESVQRVCPDVKAGTGDLLITLGRRHRLTICVTTPNGTAARGAKVWVKGTGPNLAICYGRGSDVPTADHDGRLRLDLREGCKYEITAVKLPFLPGGATCDLRSGAGAAKPLIEIHLKGTATISGVVLAKADGSPMKGLYVQMTGAAAMNAAIARMDEEGLAPQRTDDNGRFLLDGVPTGIVTLAVGPDPWGRNVLATKSVDVRPGSKTIEVQIVAQQLGSAKGVVSRAEGKPVGHCVVTLKGTSRADRCFNSMANEKGTFAFERVPPGQYLAMWYPTTKTATDLTPIPTNVTIRPGETTEITLGGKKRIQVRLSGMVRVGGKPFGPGRVTFIRLPDEPGPETELLASDVSPKVAKIKENGQFEIDGLSPGFCGIVVSRNERIWDDPDAYPRKVTIGPKQAALDISISGATLTVTVRRPTGEPLPGAAITLTPVEDEMMRKYLPGRTTTTGRHGTARLDYVSPGLYDVIAQHETLGQTAKPKVKIGEPNTHIDIAFAQRAALTGRITNATGGALAGAMVVAVSGGPTGDAMGYVRVDGTYEVRPKLPPGRYRVLVVLPGHSIEAAQVDVRGDARFDATLVAAGNLEVRLVGRPEAVAGKAVRIRDKEGAEVIRLREEGLPQCRIAPTDAGGRTMVWGLRPGKYAVSVEGTTASATATVTALDTADVEIAVK